MEGRDGSEEDDQNERFDTLDRRLFVHSIRPVAMDWGLVDVSYCLEIRIENLHIEQALPQ